MMEKVVLPRLLLHLEKIAPLPLTHHMYTSLLQHRQFEDEYLHRHLLCQVKPVEFDTVQRRFACAAFLYVTDNCAGFDVRIGVL